jgi:AcrR family transcriptional regulator
MVSPNLPIHAIPFEQLEKSKKKWLRSYQMIIDASERVFLDNGFQDSTMDQIANTALMSKTTIYKYFDRKEDLFIALGIRAYQKLIMLFDQASQSDKQGLELIQLTGWKYFEFTQKYPLYRQALDFSGPKYSGAGDFLNKFPNSIREYQALQYFQNIFVQNWMKIIQKGSAIGIIKVQYPAPLLTFLLGTLTSGFLDELEERKSILDSFQLSREKIFQMFLDIIQNGILR